MHWGTENADWADSENAPCRNGLEEASGLTWHRCRGWGICSPPSGVARTGTHNQSPTFKTAFQKTFRRHTVLWDDCHSFPCLGRPAPSGSRHLSSYQSYDSSLSVHPALEGTQPSACSKGPWGTMSHVVLHFHAQLFSLLCSAYPAGLCPTASPDVSISLGYSEVCQPGSIRSHHTHRPCLSWLLFPFHTF